MPYSTPRLSYFDNLAPTKSLPHSSYPVAYVPAAFWQIVKQT